MGYLQEKYKKEYFLKCDPLGNALQAGAAGIEEFRKGSIREATRDILRRIDFRGRHVLDIGCGRGEAVRFAAEGGAARVVGIDFSDDAIAIADDYMRKLGLTVALHREDALDFAKRYTDLIPSERAIPFDIVIMFDSVEHIPRAELSELMTALQKIVSSRGLLAVHTPHFGVDNDVLAEGLKYLAFDGTEDDEMTGGMHCNRYTRDSLKRHLIRFDWFPLSHHLFACRFPLRPRTRMASRSAREKASRLGYPIMLPQAHKAESYEGYTWKRHALMRPIRWVYMRLKYRDRLPLSVR